MSTRSLTPADTPQPASTTVAAHKQHDRSFQVLVVDQDLNDRHAVVDFLRRQGMSVTSGGEWSDVEHLFAELEFDLVILDLSISEKGLSLLSDIRFQHDFPLIVTTAPQVGEDERAVALELGADDCISKPFGLRELAAHIRAVLRRSVRANGASPACSMLRHCRFGGWHVDRRSRKLTSPAGADGPLTKSQYALLAAFIEAPLITLSCEQLLKATRVHEDLCDRSIDVQIFRLRRKLNPAPGAPDVIRTMRGTGYMFMLPVDSAD